MRIPMSQQHRLTAASQEHVKRLLCALWQATDYTDESLYRYARLAASYALDAYSLRPLKEPVGPLSVDLLTPVV